MVIKVGINGFGRIGRVIFRTCLQNPDVELAAINDPAIDIEYICYLIKFDSTHGKFKENVTHTENEVQINDRLIKVFREKFPPNVPWQTVGVQYVIEASGMFTSLDKASGHLACDSVKRVIVTAPSIDVPMIILGVNNNTISTEQKVLSCASSTLYCLAPIVKVLEENYGVAEGFITSIHAMTPSLKPLDGLCLRGRHWRDHRSIHQNIIPASTGACKALGKIIPRVKDKLSGLAFRVPIVNVSVLDLTVRLESDTNIEDIIKTVEKASQSYLQNIIKVSNEEAVSSDFSGDSHSCILDADSSLELTPNFFKIICWYENEYSYACRVLDSIFFSERQLPTPSKLPCKTTYVRAKTRKQELLEAESNKIEYNAVVSEAHKVSGSTSQETTLRRRPLTRTALLRKPLASHNTGTLSTTVTATRDTKKRNELFKIWNDNNDAQKTAVRSNRSSFFHSCMAFAPKKTETTDCMNAQERLENVKKEFSKMANITEDLLKKSYSNKLQQENTVTTLEEDKTDNNVGEDPKIVDNETFVPPTSNSIYKVCGDFKKRVMKRHAADCNKEEINCNNPSEGNENSSEYNMSGNVKKGLGIKSMRLAPSHEETVINQNSTINLCLFINGQNTENPSISTDNVKSSSTISFQKQVVNTVNNFFEKYGNDSNLSNATEYTDNIPEVSDIESSPTKALLQEEEVLITATEDDDLSLEIDNSSTHSQTRVAPEHDLPDKPKYSELYKYLQNKNYNMQIVDEELKKRNIVLENSEKDKDVESDLSVKFSSMDSDQLAVASKLRRGMNLNKQILDSLNRLVPEPVIVIPEETSGYCSPEDTMITTSSGNGKRNKLDLYDKLDSTSGTDSNNSFEVKERKSQVIHITDLTNSFDDLARLDKICRIIEISDELSDKLFSSLEQPALTEADHKQWSFRDLCERIQLDDFCNKVFGKTSS